jgi:hypothetical protein
LVLVFVVTLFLPRRVATVATLPSALFKERASLGASWVFSFQPVLPLFIDLGSILKNGSGARLFVKGKLWPKLFEIKVATRR